MTIFDILLHPGMFPFELAVGIVAGLLVLEVLANQLGASILGNADTDMDLDADVDLDADIDLDLDTDLDLDAESIGLDEDISLSDEAPAVDAGEGALSWLGLGRVPFMIWLTGMLTAFALVGYGLQLAATGIFGAPLGPWLASAIATVPGVLLGSRVATWIGALFPKTTTTAISRASYGRRRGVITVGTASTGKPAQARFTDGHGNMHYAMVEPLDAQDTLPQGTEILILKTKDGALRAVRTSA